MHVYAKGDSNMKKFKILFLSLIASVCLLFGAAVLAACGDTGENGGGNNGGTTYYTVTLDYDSTKGTVTKSDSAAKDGYVKDETVTLTVTAKENYTVEAVKAGTTTLTAGTDGKYSFKVAGNTTVSVTFADAKPAGDPVLLDAALYGTYKDMEGKADDLVVSAAGIKWGDKDVFLASPYEDGDLFYAVTVDGAAYELHVNAADSTISLNTSDFSTELTFLKEGATLSYTVTVQKTGEGTATLDPVKEKYDQGDSVTLTVTAAEDWFVKDVVVNGETISLEDGAYTFTVTMETTIVVTFLAEGEIPTEFQGTWTNIEDSNDKFTLTADSITWTGHTASIESIKASKDYTTGERNGVVVEVSIDDDHDDTTTEELTMTFYYGTTAVYLSWASADHSNFYDYHFVSEKSIGVSADVLSEGTFSEIGGTTKLSLNASGELSAGNTVLPVYHELSPYGDMYLTVYNNAPRRLYINNDNYLYFDPLNWEAEDQNTYRFLRDNFKVEPFSLLVGEWTSADDVKLNFKQDGTVEVTGAEGTTIILLASSMSETSVLLIKDDEAWEATFVFVPNDTSLSFDLELVHEEMPVEFTSPKQAVPLVLDAAWQTGYTYNGDEDVPFKAFVADTTGLGFVDQFNKFIEGSYSNAIKLSDTEYLVFKEGDWGMITMYLFTLNSDKTITVSDEENEYVYEPGELIELEAVEIMLEYESSQGSANIAGETADGGWGDIYTLAIPASGPLTLTVIVTPNGGYKVKSVKAGNTTLTDEAGNGRYSYTVTASGEVTIVIEFDVAELEPLAISDTSLYGSYSGTDSYADDPVTKTLTVDASGVKFDNEVVKLIEKYSDTAFKVMIGTTTYTLTFDTSSNAIMLSEINYSEDYYLRKDGGSTAPTTYSVTIGYGNDDYAAAMGSAVADEGSYSDGDTVTITITPGTGYTVDSVAVDGETATVTAGANGTYTVTFEIHADAEVVVTFKAAAAA